MPLFTVVIPLYNKENYIAATLNSILAQTFTDFEIVIVNDVCTDNSVVVAQSFKDSRIRIITHPYNRGLSASRNTGIKNATAPYVTFIDADDAWKPLFLETMHCLIKQFPEAGLYASHYAEIYKGGVAIVHPLQLPTSIIHNFFESSLRQPIYCQSGFCVKKSVFEEVGYYNEQINFSEDIDFNIRANYSYTLAYCNEPLTNYTIHSENQITQKSLKNKKIPDLDYYEPLTVNRPDIKRYLDFNRYFFARRYKLAGDAQGYKKMIAGLDTKSLNYKQIALLYAPAFILKQLQKLKSLLVQKGINPTTY